MHHQQKWTHHRETDRLEILERTVWQLRMQDGIEGETAGDAEQQGVAVGRRLRGKLGADDSARASAIIDDDLLSQALAELLRKHARYDVSAAARRLRYDQAHRPGGLIGTGPYTAKQYTRRRYRPVAPA